MKQYERLNIPIDLAMDIAGLLKRAGIQASLDGSDIDGGLLWLLIYFDHNHSMHDMVKSKIQEMIRSYHMFIIGMDMEEDN